MCWRTSILAIVVLALATSAQSRPIAQHDWVAYRNAPYGFRLTYPADVFAVERESERGDGQVLISSDGSARLLIGAFANTDRHTPPSYQQFVARNSYGNFTISYSPRGQSWFVLSGEGNGTMFYEKVMFSCGGGVINSFAMTYPVEKRRLFDPIVEGIEKTFRPGEACTAKAAATTFGTPHAPASDFYRYPTSYRGEAPPTMPPTVGDYLSGNQQPYVQVTPGVWYWPGASDVRMARIPSFDPQIDPSKVIDW